MGDISRNSHGRAVQALHERLVLAGWGWGFVSDTGHVDVRSLIDVVASSSSERLWFEGKVKLADPRLEHVTAARKPTVFNAYGGALDTALVPDLSDAERLLLDETAAAIVAANKDESARKRAAWTVRRRDALIAKGVDPERAARTVGLAVERQILSDDYEVPFDDGTSATVAEILADPMAYHRKTGPDPLEPEYGGGRNKAILFGVSSPVRIESQAHGRITYVLQDYRRYFEEPVGEGPAPSSTDWYEHPSPEAKKPDQTRKRVSASAYAFVDPATLPRRSWIYGGHYIRKFVSATVAPSKVGKSSLVIAEALAMASGKPLLGVMPQGEFRVWYWNGEDPFDELQRRVEATRCHYALTPEDLGGRFFLDSGRETAIVLASQGREGSAIAIPVVTDVIQTIRDNRIDVTMIDPFISSHQVPENDNNAIDLVAKQWASIADVTNSAIELVHHVRKTNGAETTIEDSRGAGSLVAASRSARALTRMPDAVAKKLGLEDGRRSIFRFNDATSNLAPPAPNEQTLWMKMIPTDLGNGRSSEAGGPGDSDQVGVVVTFALPTGMDGVEIDDEEKILAAVANGSWRKDPQSRDAWVGVPVAQALGVDLDDPDSKARVKAVLKQMLQTGQLREVNKLDSARRPKIFIEPGSLSLKEGVFK